MHESPRGLDQHPTPILSPPSEEVQSGFLGLIFSADKAVTSASSPDMYDALGK